MHYANGSPMIQTRGRALRGFGQEPENIWDKLTIPRSEFEKVAYVSDRYVDETKKQELPIWTFKKEPAKQIRELWKNLVITAEQTDPESGATFVTTAPATEPGKRTVDFWAKGKRSIGFMLLAPLSMAGGASSVSDGKVIAAHPASPKDIVSQSMNIGGLAIVPPDDTWKKVVLVGGVGLVGAIVLWKVFK